MTLTLLLTLLCCLLMAATCLIAVLWRRDARRHAAERSDAELREREAVSQLAASAARLAAAERQTVEAREALQRQEERLTALTEERMRTETELAALRASSEAEIETLRKQNAEQTAAYKAEREATEERFRAQFKNLATEILGEQSQHFRQTSRESIDLLLKPFRDNITDFRKRVEEIYTTQTSQRGELKAELNRLMELNRHISTEAQNLTQALKGNSKIQGDWGEMLLETILDNSALTKGIHYETQYNIKDEEGRNLRPDVVLHLPEKKQIIIDSKVSLTAFVAYTSAETDEERRRALAAHVASVRQHVVELGRKEYQRRFNSPDFVIMFIPNEPAFLAALQSDPAIWSDAYDRKVIVSSPTNLFALLKLVADLWKYNDQDKNTKEIATCGLKLYEQLVAFTASLEGIGTALDKAHDAYDDAYKRLCTGNDNIVRVGERLRRTARLQTKRHHSARTLELAGDEDGASPETEDTASAEPAGAAETPQLSDTSRS
ncbi:DNA recombination protein RmuC [Alistipes sp.]|uniref:DNA recombination protein RmuC n=1 Tax=Alistipes sp. TaxID=1872444 RepID=UPI0025BAA3F4|nr:DNA recombination protein RmuC [Alistipes sp.]MCI7140795.1 DNA recombination protein RmuC [Alistipes sp.]MDY5396118.1 DNA recombination protein RmuC [Alistipes sp.]